eukprot:COSAG05_NODE_1198_length_5555_cov_3.672287_8_plen_138_part_00
MGCAVPEPLGNTMYVDPASPSGDVVAVTDSGCAQSVCVCWTATLTNVAQLHISMISLRFLYVSPYYLRHVAKRIGVCCISDSAEEEGQEGHTSTWVVVLIILIFVGVVGFVFVHMNSKQVSFSPRAYTYMFFARMHG